MFNHHLMPLDAAQISPLDRGWTLADGCFETLRVVDGAAVWLDAHLARLRRGLHILAIPEPDVARLPDDLARLLAAHQERDGVARLQITRGIQPERGLAALLNPTPTMLLTLAPPVPLPAQPVECRAIIATRTRRNEWSPLSQIKATANYPDLLLALAEAHERGADEALLRNTAGAVVCGTVANVWAVRDGRLHTPPLNAGATAGILRQHLIVAAQSWGVTVVETSLSPADVLNADEVLLTNVVRGVQAVVSLDGQPIGNGAAGAMAQRVLAWVRVAQGLGIRTVR